MYLFSGKVDIRKPDKTYFAGSHATVFCKIKYGSVPYRYLMDSALFIFDLLICSIFLTYNETLYVEITSYVKPDRITILSGFERRKEIV